MDRVAWRVASSMDSVDWVQRKVTQSSRRCRRWTPMGRSRNPPTGTAVGCRLTAGRDGRKLAVFAMSPKPHSYRCLHEEILPRANKQDDEWNRPRRTPAGLGHPKPSGQPASAWAEGAAPVSRRCQDSFRIMTAVLWSWDTADTSPSQ